MTRTTQPGRPEGDPVAPESAGRTTLDRIFDPRSVVVVGASTDPAKRGFQILRALAASGYDGNVLPVNPKGGTILDFEVHPSIAELPHGADLAVFCTPARAAPDLLRECGRKGIAGAVVLAVGFGESGEEGRRLQEALLEAGRESGVRIVGPNTSGLLNMQRGVNLVGARGVRAGSIALLVQSGNIALSMMNEVTERSWGGLSISLGVGNAIDLGFAEALDYLEGHHETSAIIAYLEGVNDPRAFLTSAARVSRTKPIVVIKSGRTTAGATAALSHTGALAGPYDRLRAGLRQAGVVEVTRTDELLHVAETLGGQPPCPEGRGIAILSDGGGQSTLAVDTLTESDTLLSQLSESTSSALRELLGPAAAVRNPVDLAGAADGDPEMFGRAMEVLAADPSVGAVLVIGLFGGYGIRFSETLTPGEVLEPSGWSRRAAEPAWDSSSIRCTRAIAPSPSRFSAGRGCRSSVLSRSPVAASRNCRTGGACWHPLRGRRRPSRISSARARYRPCSIGPGPTIAARCPSPKHGPSWKMPVVPSRPRWSHEPRTGPSRPWSASAAPSR